MIAALLALSLSARAGELVLQVSHSLPIQAVAFSPDGRRAATAGRDGQVAVWDAATGVKLRSIPAEMMGATAVAFCPDGRCLVSAGAGTASLWDAASGRLLRRFGEPGEFLHWIAFSPDGRTLYAAGDDDAIKLWDARSGKLKGALHTNGGRKLLSAALSADGALLAAADGGASLFVWNALTGDPRPAPSGGSEWKTVAFLPGGRLASGSDEWAAVWDLAKGVEVTRVRAAAGRVLAASPDGRWLATSGGSTARLWSAADGTEGRALIGHLDAVTSAVFSADGRFVLTGSADRTAIVWTAPGGSARRKLAGETLEPLFAAPSRDGLLTVDAKAARLWDLGAGRPRRSARGAWDGSCRFAASRDGRVLAWRREPGLLDARDLAVSRSASGWPAPAAAEAFALEPRGAFVAASREGRLSGFDPATGKPAGPALPELSASRLLVADGGERLVAVDARGEVSAWEVPSGRRTASLRVGDSLMPRVALSEDGRLLAAAGAARAGGSAARFRLTVRSLDDGREVRGWDSDTELDPLAFSADDASLWTRADNALWNWDLGTGNKVAAVSLPAGAELAGEQALDPKRGWAAARLDGELLLLSLSTGRELARVTLTDRGWLARSPDGRLDGGGAAAVWSDGVKARPLSSAPGYTPGLLAQLLR